MSSAASRDPRALPPLPWAPLPIPVKDARGTAAHQRLWSAVKRIPRAIVRTDVDLQQVFADVATGLGYASWAELPEEAVGALLAHLMEYQATVLHFDATLTDFALRETWLHERWGGHVPWSSLLAALVPTSRAKHVPRDMPGHPRYHAQAFTAWWRAVAATNAWAPAFARLATDAPATERLVPLALTTLQMDTTLAAWLEADLPARWPQLDRVLRLSTRGVPGGAASQLDVWRWAARQWPDVVLGGLSKDVAVAQQTLSERLERDSGAFRLVATHPGDGCTGRRLRALTEDRTLCPPAWAERLGAQLEQLDASWGGSPLPAELRPFERVSVRFAGAWQLLCDWPDAEVTTTWGRLDRLAARHPDPHRYRDLWRHAGMTPAKALELLDTRGGADLRAGLADNRALLRRSAAVRSRLRATGQNKKIWARLYETAATAAEAAEVLELLGQAGAVGLRTAGRLLAKDTRWAATPLVVSTSLLKAFLLSKDRVVREFAMGQMDRADLVLETRPLTAKPPKLRRRRLTP